MPCVVTSFKCTIEPIRTKILSHVYQEIYLQKNNASFIHNDNSNKWQNPTNFKSLSSNLKTNFPT